MSPERPSPVPGWTHGSCRRFHRLPLTHSVPLAFPPHISPLAPPMDTEPLLGNAVRRNGTHKEKRETSRYYRRCLELVLTSVIHPALWVSKPVRDQNLQCRLCSDQTLLCALLLAHNREPLGMFKYNVFTNTCVSGHRYIRTLWEQWESQERLILFKGIVSTIRNVCIPPGNAVFTVLRKQSYIIKG